MEQQLQRLEQALERADITEMEAEFEAVEERIQEQENLRQDELKNICHVMLYIVNEFIQNHFLNAEEYLEELEQWHDKIGSVNTFPNYREWSGDLLDRVCRLNGIKQDIRMDIISAQQYIREHFKEDITLKSVADHLGFSASYLSRLFSQETGNNFIDYLIRVRMEHAKELLDTTNCRVYEIASMTGYGNPYYFSRIFKKYTGYSPGDYKNRKGTVMGEL